MAHASFEGLRVLSLESRRAKETEKLIRTYGGEAFVVPAMREVKLDSNRAALEFTERLLRGEVDVVLFLTGVGVRALMDTVVTKYDRGSFLEALRKSRIVTRGPKPEAALRELQVKSVASAPEPSTWSEVLATMDRTFGEELATLRVAVQEYGASNPELLAGLTERTAEVIKVPVYQWALPHDLQPLRESVHAIANGGISTITSPSGRRITPCCRSRAHTSDPTRRRGSKRLRAAFCSTSSIPTMKPFWRMSPTVQ